MDRIRRYTPLGMLVACVFTLVMLAVIYFAPSYKNELQIVEQVLLVIALFAAFAVISKNVKRICRDKINNLNNNSK